MGRGGHRVPKDFRDHIFIEMLPVTRKSYFPLPRSLPLEGGGEGADKNFVARSMVSCGINGVTSNSAQ